MSIPEQISGISLGDSYLRPGTTGPITSVTYIAGGWITVDSKATLDAIDQSRTATGQIAYVSESKQFYIANKVEPNWEDTFDYTVSWSEFTFSGSFQGDGSQLTGIASSLYLTGSVGTDTINLKDDALTLTGSAGGIIVTVTDNKATFTIASPATISGSFTGDGSGLSGVGGVAGGTANQIQYNSASAFEGAEIYYSSSGNLGIGVTNPSVKLHVDGDATITGILTAQEFHTEFVSSSVLYESGSTKFGNSADDTHQFTGSVNIQGAVTATNYSGSFSGSFQGDGSNLTGIASTLALSGSTGNDLVNLKTDALTLTGSAKNIDVAVTNNKSTFSVSNDLTLSNVNLTGSFKGAFGGTFSGSIDAVIENALTASYVLNAISASHVPGYVRDNGGVTDEVAIWSSTDQISGSQGFFVSRSFGGNVATFLDGYYYSQNDGRFIAQGVADDSGSKPVVGIYNDTGGGKGVFYAGSGSGVTTGAIQIANSQLMNAYAIGTGISPNKANTLRIEPAVELLAGITGSLYGSASYAPTASYVPGYVRDGGGAANELAFWTNGDTISGSSVISYNTGGATLNVTGNVLAASFTGSFSGSFSGLITNAVSASYATTSLTASYFTGSHIDFTPLSDAQAPPHREGRVWYDADNGALAVYNDEADITLQVGQEFYVRVYNNSTSSIANGTPVYISGSQGDYPYIWPATAEDHTTGAHFDNHILGLATHDIEASSAGYVTRQGIVRNIDTTAFAAGDDLFLQTGSAGLRNTPPPFPYDVVQVGFVVRSQANGFVLVDTKEPVHFSNISGLSGSGAAQNHDLWVFDSSNNAWYNTHSGLELSGSFSGSFYGSLVGTATTASYVKNAVSASYTAYAASAGTSATASFVSGYAKGSGVANEVTVWKTADTISGSNWLTITSSFNATGIPAVLMDGNYYSYAQTATGGNGYVAFSGSAATTASIMGLNVSQNEGQLYSANAGVVKSAIRLSTIYNEAYTIGRFLTPGTDNLLRIAPDVLILGSTTIDGDLTVGGIVTAQEFHTEFVSASIIYQSGSTKFGDSSDDVHQFTGSVNITDQLYAGLDSEVRGQVVGYNTTTGELTYFDSSSILATAIPGGSDNQIQYNNNGAMAGASGFVWDGTNVGIGTASPTVPLHVEGNILVTGTSPTFSGGALEIQGTANAVKTFYLNRYGVANGSQHRLRAANAYFEIASANSEPIALEGGSVGIGTTAPGSKLTVNGAIESITDPGGEGGQLILRGPVYRYNLDNFSGSKMRFFREDDATAGSGAELFSIASTGQLRANFYGSGTFTGTPTKTLAVTSNGTVIEIDVSSNGTGVANEVAFWKDTDTVSGSQDFTWDGTTLSINGVLEANEKSFVIDHPTQEGKKLVYGVLEGPEHAVYCRGKISGEVIELPEEWTGLVHEDSITVQLTSIGKHQNLYVVNIRDNKVFIKNGDLLTSKINAYYYIQATRKDTKPLQTVRDK